MIATAEDISRVIRAIPLHELVRLRIYVENRIARIGPTSANGRTNDDLLQEAVIRLLDGTRHWDVAKVGIVNCLIGVMRSIARAWAAYWRRNGSSPEFAPTKSAPVRTRDARELDSHLCALATGLPNPEDLVIAEEVNAGRQAFADEIEMACDEDPGALRVLAAFECGVDGVTLQNDFGWSETRYRTTVRRIKPRAQALLTRRHGQLR